jgi:50S ribosomal protein L16 3-hydroxylase
LKTLTWRAGIDWPAFLARDWQVRPRLFRRALHAWSNPLAPAALHELAARADCESRLITRARSSWRLEHGPIAGRTFGRLPRAGWTLLVQAVDQHVAAVARMLDAFDFLPDWRIDDVMVSLAARGGGVGPHFDHYDVFLIQGLGRRRWQLGARSNARAALAPHPDLRLLAHFVPRTVWVLEPGDMLYVPPGFAHCGTAVSDDCMTYSVGLRAPSRGELVSHWCDEVLAHLDEDDRYADRGRLAARSPGEFDRTSRARLYAMVREALADRRRFDAFCARWLSEPKYATPRTPITPRALRAGLARGRCLARHPASRYLYTRTGGELVLYVDGEAHPCVAAAASIVRRLCGSRTHGIGAREITTPDTRKFVEQLCARGALQWDGDD